MDHRIKLIKDNAKKKMASKYWIINKINLIIYFLFYKDNKYINLLIYFF